MASVLAPRRMSKYSLLSKSRSVTGRHSHGKEVADDQRARLQDLIAARAAPNVSFHGVLIVANVHAPCLPATVDAIALKETIALQPSQEPPLLSRPSLCSQTTTLPISS